MAHKLRVVPNAAYFNSTQHSERPDPPLSRGRLERRGGDLQQDHHSSVV